jgi:transcriptional regulator with PAS, ATPase and Fis domain
MSQGIKKRILISWIAYKHDFIEEKGRLLEVSSNGTHADFYSRLYNDNYDKHLLLSTFHQDFPNKKFSLLLEYLRTQSSLYDIEPVYMDIEDIISVEEIKSKVFVVLSKYKDQDVDIYISPGTPAMQTAWYLLASEFKNVKLFQVRPPIDKGSDRQREYIEVLQSGFSAHSALREEKQRKGGSNDSSFITISNQGLFNKAREIALNNRSTVLILGETGTGKGVLAQYIHNESLRNKRKLIPLNCGAMGDELLESRLFGYMEGSHGTAYKDTPGAFENADKSTLFLDEIGDISKKMQQTLLKVLDDGEVYRIGSSNAIKVDVRIIAATNKDLLQLVREGKFRADLYHRLAVVELETTPFRVYQKEEQQKFMNHFIKKLETEYDRKFPKLTSEVKKYINNYWFPGNIREVAHLMESFCACCESEVTVDDLPNRITNPENGISSLLLDDIVNAHIKKVWKMFGGNKQKAAYALGISYNKVKKYINNQ